MDLINELAKYVGENLDNVLKAAGIAAMLITYMKPKMKALNLDITSASAAIAFGCGVLAQAQYIFASGFSTTDYQAVPSAIVSILAAGAISAFTAAGGYKLLEETSKKAAKAE